MLRGACRVAAILRSGDLAASTVGRATTSIASSHKHPALAAAPITPTSPDLLPVFLRPASPVACLSVARPL
eukprot:6203483-Pleurochrysis_carterae.AAC.3